jgi:hypothetical protein
MFHLSLDHDSVEYLQVYDDTICTQIENQVEAAKREKKAKEEAGQGQKTQNDLDGL